MEGTLHIPPEPHHIRKEILTPSPEDEDFFEAINKTFKADTELIETVARKIKSRIGTCDIDGIEDDISEIAETAARVNARRVRLGLPDEHPLINKFDIAFTDYIDNMLEINARCDCKYIHQ